MMNQSAGAGARLSVSSWSLHRTLGRPGFHGPEQAGRIPATSHGRGMLLTDLPAHIASLGIGTMEICHFHLPSLDPAYLAELRAAREAAGVELFSLLVDGGDLADPVDGERDLAWVRGWVPVAEALGARRMRVIAGKAQPSEGALAKSHAALAALAEEAGARGVRLMTENWFGLLSRPEMVDELLTRLDGAVGLCLDFGNWGGPTKYENLARIARWAESCHAKPHFTGPGAFDREDYARCLDLTREAGFAGPYTLIYDGPSDDEAAGIALVRDAVRPYTSRP